MATMYDSGYGGDKGASYGGYDPMEEERRRRREQQQGAQQQNPYQQQNQQAQQAFNQAQQNQQAQQAFNQAQPKPAAPPKPQQNFAQMQQAGEARPAPPQAQPAPQAQNQQMQQAFNQAQPVQMMPGGPMPVSQFGGQPMQQLQQMGPPGQPFMSAGIDPVAMMANSMGDTMPPGGPQGFTGDIGAYLGNQLNSVGQGLTNLPNAYIPDAALGQQIMALAGQGLPNAPTFTPDQQLMEQARQLTGTGGGGASGGASAGGTSAASPADWERNSWAESAQREAAQRAQQDANRPENRLQSAGYTLWPLQGGGFDVVQQQGDGSFRPVSRLTSDYRPMDMNNPTYNTAGGQLPDELRSVLAGAVDPRSARMGDAGRAGASLQAGGGPAVSAAGVNPVAAMAGGAAGGSAGGGAGGGRGSFDSLLQDAYNNPSAFDNAAVQDLYNRMGQDIDDRFAQEQRSLQNDMAARGLSDSSITGGRMADLNVGRRSARTELANQLGIQRAQDFANQRNAVLGLGLQQQGQNLQAELGRGNLDVNRQQAATSAELGRGNLGIQQGRLSLDQQGQQFGQRMQGLQFQNQLGQQNFANQLAAGDFGLRRAGQAFNQGLQGAQFQNALGQQGFQNQMSLADLQRARSNDLFSQRMGITDRLTGYGQQAFDNDFRTAQFNRESQNDQWRRYLDSLALGG